MLKEHIIKRDIIENIEDNFEVIDYELREDMAESSSLYASLLCRNMKLLKDYPVIEDILTTEKAITMTPKEHKAMHEYLGNEATMDLSERMYLYYRGFLDCFEYLKKLGDFNSICDDCDNVSFCQNENDYPNFL